MEKTSGQCDMGVPEVSVFNTKYNEFVEDLLGTLPEYTLQIKNAKALDDKTRLSRFQEEVKVGNTFGTEITETETAKNPKLVLPGVEISDDVWSSLSNNSQKAIWEYVRILSICCFMEAGFSEDSKPPAWMDDAMNNMKEQLEGIDFQDIIKKFSTFFKSTKGAASFNAADGTGATDEGNTEGNTEGAGAGAAGFEKIFENGFPKIPEKFLKGHMARLAQEIVKDITPDELGISPEMIGECEKNPSRAFDILFQVFGSNPDIIQKTVQKIGKRLQQKIATGNIRPQEIAREAEELMKEFANNPSFVDMMDGIKSAFGFEDMNLARKAGREGSARLAIVKERLRKKVADKNGVNKLAQLSVTAESIAHSETALASLLKDESTQLMRNPLNKAQKKKSTGGIKK